MNRAELKLKAKEQLRGKWGIAIGTVLVAQIITELGSVYNVSSSLEVNTLLYLLSILPIFLSGVIATGLCRFLLNMATDKEAKFENLFSYFNIFFKTLGLNLLISIAVFIGTLLFVIPGIIVGLMFSQAYFILAEDSSKSITQCLSESKDMMYGYKADLFVLQLSFIGWWILAALTLGIGGLWVTPYQRLTEANYYLKLKENR